jgi:hypothetical protein
MYLNEYDDMVEDFYDKWEKIPEDQYDTYKKVYGYIAQLYYDYYTTFYNYYVKGEYYSDNNGKYYKFGSSSALSSDNDADKNDLIKLTLLTEKLCDSQSAYEQYVVDLHDGNVDDNYVIDLKTAENPNGKITEAQLKAAFDYCESNNTGLGLKLSTLNQYICAQKNLENFDKAFKAWAESTNYSVPGISHEQILNEADRLRDGRKYLCTLQQGISAAQMDEMDAERVILVVPHAYIGTYPKDRQNRIWTIGKFVTYVKELERG